jgi:hypothetical protein
VIGMEHIDLILPTLRKFIHKMLNDIATCIHRDEGQFRKMYDEIRAIWRLNVKQPDDACAVLLWYVLKALEEWIPNEDFACGWSEALRLHESEIADEDPDSDVFIPSYGIRNPNAFFPRMSEKIKIGWNVIFDTHILCMMKPEIQENTHLRILLQSDQEIPNNQIIELMPSELSMEEVARIELNYLLTEYKKGDEFTKLRFTTNQLTWILCDWIRSNGRNSAYHFAYVPEHPHAKDDDEDEAEREQKKPNQLLKDFLDSYYLPATKHYLYSDPFKPRPPIPEKYPLGSKMHPIFHIQEFEDGQEPAGIFVGFIIAYHDDVEEFELLEGTEFVEYDEKTVDYLNNLTKIDHFPFASYAAILFGLNKAFVLDRSKMVESFDKISEHGWFSLLNDDGEYILDINTAMFAQMSFKIPEKFKHPEE